MFDHKKIEKKWSKYWLDKKVYKTTNNSKKKFYVLDMFPYPSGKGLHVGHPEGYTATDIIARYKRFLGFDVLHPIGWDAFGLPAEQYAIQTGKDPKTFTMQNINNFRKQLIALGFSLYYDKEVNTTDPKYFKWTQWIFGQMFKNNLAKLENIEVNWCEELGTVLANEEVLTLEDGTRVSERGEFLVVKKPMQQWVLKITNYADKLLEGLNDLDWPESLKALQRNWIGKETKNNTTTYKLHDWVFSRQRYWGEPFPLVFDDQNNVYLVENLPVELPVNSGELEFSKKVKAPLDNFKDWLNVNYQNKKMRRETNTMPQWAGSSWYYLAYILKNDDDTYTPLNSAEAWKRFQKWLPVDLYIGGQEHAVLHLLYARFWHKVLYDLKIVPTSEPFQKVVNQGMILGENNQKMSKSKGNVINPDDIVQKYGADTLRVYEMFMGPLTETKAWSNKGLKGIRRWLERVWRMYDLALNQSQIKIIPLDTNVRFESTYNEMIFEVTNLIEDLKFNVAISKLMVFINYVFKNKIVTTNALQSFAIILSVFAPFLGEELYSYLNLEKPLNHAKWPKINKAVIIEKSIVIAIQINGKLRATLELEKEASESEIIKQAKGLTNVQKYLKNSVIAKVVYVNNKILNFIIKKQ